jgi:5-oxoprolinase (ATP-hydrolysing) subunit C
MSGTLKIERPGLATGVQDLGRIGWQRYGVPFSGALDPLAARLANALVGNEANAAVLEILALGPSFTVEAESVRLALVGSDVGLTIDGNRIEPNHSVVVERGAMVAIGGFTDAASCLLAVEGGFDLAPVMGSRSTYARGGFGGFSGRALRPGDLLPLIRDTASPGPDRRAGEIPYGQGPIRLVLGPQADWFEPDSIAEFLSTPYEITAEADRMGMRLAGPTLRHAKGFNIVSDGIVTGALQVPGTGQPIVLLADHQTVGGYPKIGTVISADLPRLGRMRPGAALRFVAVEPAVAETLRREQETEFLRLIAAIAPMTSVPTTEDLLAANLISGVVSAGG